MKILSFSEENYLKALYKLTYESDLQEKAGTNEIASQLDIKPASVNNMLKKLSNKKLIVYEKYGKSSLTKEGKKIALEVIRKHRLWETFLCEKLSFTWDEVHEVAEQLEHIQSKKLIDKLDQFLDYPPVDPHGDPIPNAKGEISKRVTTLLLHEHEGHTCEIIGVNDNSSSFLKYADSLGIAIHEHISVIERSEYDDLMEIEINGTRNKISPKFAEQIVVTCESCANKKD